MVERANTCPRSIACIRRRPHPRTPLAIGDSTGLIGTLGAVEHILCNSPAIGMINTTFLSIRGFADPSCNKLNIPTPEHFFARKHARRANNGQLKIVSIHVPFSHRFVDIFQCAIKSTRTLGMNFIDGLITGRNMLIAHGINRVGANMDKPVEAICQWCSRFKKIVRTRNIDLVERLIVHTARWTQNICRMNNRIYTIYNIATQCRIPEIAFDLFNIKGIELGFLGIIGQNQRANIISSLNQLLDDIRAQTPRCTRNENFAHSCLFYTLDKRCTTSNRSDSVGCDQSSPAPLITASRSGLARQPS